MFKESPIYCLKDRLPYSLASSKKINLFSENYDSLAALAPEYVEKQAQVGSLSLGWEE